MGVDEDDGYERKEFWSDYSCSIFCPSSSVKHLMMELFVKGPVNGRRRLKLYLSTNCIIIMAGITVKNDDEEKIEEFTHGSDSKN